MSLNEPLSVHVIMQSKDLIVGLRYQDGHTASHATAEIVYKCKCKLGLAHGNQKICTSDMSVLCIVYSVDVRVSALLRGDNLSNICLP